MTIFAAFNNANAYDFEVDGIYYTISSFSESECKVDGCSRGKNEIFIPSIVNYSERNFKVTAISEESFKLNKDIKIVRFDNFGNFIIKDSSFYECQNLEEIYLDGVFCIERNAFYNCNNLKNITITDKIELIEEEAFGTSSNIKSMLNIKESETALDIKSNSFKGRSLDYLFIGREFYQLNCDVYDLEIGKNILYLPSGLNFKMEYLNLSSSNIIELKAKTFYDNASIKKLILPDKLKSIGAYCFYNCENLNEVNIPEYLLQIGERAFYNCKSLTSISFPNASIILGNYAFYGSGIQSLTCNINHISQGAFSNCNNIKKIEFSNDVQTIGKDAFKNNILLESLVIPSSVISIGPGCFSGCDSVKSIIIDDCQDSLLIYSDTNDKIYISPFPYSSIKYLYLGRNIYPDSYINWSDSTWKNFDEIGKTTYYYYNYQNYFNFSGIEIIEFGPNYEMIYQRPEYRSSYTTVRTVTDCSGIHTQYLDTNIAITNFVYDIDIREVENAKTIIVNSNRVSTNIEFNRNNYLNTELLCTNNDFEYYTNNAPWKNFLNFQLFDTNKSSIYLSDYTIELSIGNSKSLNAFIIPYTKEVSLNWKSDNTDIAMVSDSGVVTGVGIGTTLISAIWGDVSAICEVTVTDTNGIEDVREENTFVNIYSIDGILVKKQCPVNELNNLGRGLYIIQTRNRIFKLQK